MRYLDDWLADIGIVLVLLAFAGVMTGAVMALMGVIL